MITPSTAEQAKKQRRQIDQHFVDHDVSTRESIQKQRILAILRIRINVMTMFILICVDDSPIITNNENKFLENLNNVSLI